MLYALLLLSFDEIVDEGETLPDIGEFIVLE